MPTPRPTRLTPRATRCAVAALVAMALVAAHLLGLAHRVAHAPGHEAAHAHAGWSEQLYGEHREAGSCDLYDQLSHAAAAPCVAAQWSASSEVERLVAIDSRAVASTRREAARARGPPSLG